MNTDQEEASAIDQVNKQREARKEERKKWLKSMHQQERDRLLAAANALPFKYSSRPPYGLFPQAAKVSL